MWIFGSDFFVSIVAPTPGTKHYRDGKLCVRARVPGDITRAFGKSWAIEEGQGTDYRFRAFLPQERVAEAMALAVTNITATNFKDSVKDQDRHDAYMRVWSAMVHLQTVKGGRRWRYGGEAHKGGVRVAAARRRVGQPTRQEDLENPMRSETLQHGGPMPSDMSDEDWADYLLPR